jgi:hypothetical protein
VICQASSSLVAENLHHGGALPLGRPVDAPGRAQELRIDPICPATMRTSTQDPLEELLELLVAHPSPASMASLLGPLMVILLRDLQLALLDAELEGTGL